MCPLSFVYFSLEYIIELIHFMEHKLNVYLCQRIIVLDNLSD